MTHIPIVRGPRKGARPSHPITRRRRGRAVPDRLLRRLFLAAPAASASCHRSPAEERFGGDLERTHLRRRRSGRGDGHSLVRGRPW